MAIGMPQGLAISARSLQWSEMAVLIELHAPVIQARGLSPGTSGTRSERQGGRLAGVNRGSRENDSWK